MAKKPVDIANVYRLYGGIYGYKNGHEEAKKYLTKACELLRNQPEYSRLYITSLYNLAYAYFNLSDTDTALRIVNECLHEAEKNESEIDQQSLALMLKINILEKIGSYKELVPLYHQYLALNNELNDKKNKESLASLILTQEIKQMEQQSADKLGLLKVQQKQREFKILSVIILLIVVLIIILLLLRQRNIELKTKKMKEESLQMELNYKKRELVSKMLLENQNNEIITQTIKKLSTIPSLNEESTVFINELTNNLKFSINENTMSDFNCHFTEIHPNFITDLLSDFPNLTQNELRLCTFYRLNLSSKEISVINNIHVNSVKIARKRLRKSLKIDDPNESLITFLSKY